MDDSKQRYCFLVDWFDTHAQLTREYEFFFYPSDATIEMVIEMRFVERNASFLIHRFYLAV